MTDRVDQPGAPGMITDQFAFTPAPETAMKALCDGVAELLRVAPQPPGRLRVRLGEVSVDLAWPAAAPLASAATTPPVSGVGDSQAPQAPVHEVVSPLVATVYRAPQPGAKPYVEVGDLVVAGQQLAVLEAMKLLHPVEADRPGRVTAILAEDGAPVEYGQPLIHVELVPDDEAADV